MEENILNPFLADFVRSLPAFYYFWAMKQAYGLLLILCLVQSLVVRSLLSLGVNFGVGGVRSSLIDRSRKLIHTSASTTTKSSGQGLVKEWNNVINTIFRDIPMELRADVSSVCVSGTMDSALLYDANTGSVSRSPLMSDCNIKETDLGDEYTEAATKALRQVKLRVPFRYQSCLPTSSLSKLVAWHLHRPLLPSERLLHQTDYITNSILDRTSDPARVVTDWHNAHSLGFGASEMQYADMLFEMFEMLQIDPVCLPEAVRPGSVVGTIDPKFAAEFGFNPECKVIAGTHPTLFCRVAFPANIVVELIYAGTTENVAEFIATGVRRAGQGVTDVGDRLGFRLLSTSPVYLSKRGVHSMRFDPDHYLIEARSNAGCGAICNELFTEKSIELLSSSIDSDTDSSFRYYPLLEKGEIFPLSDPEKQPVVVPIPMKKDGTLDRVKYLHGLFEAVARVERGGYRVLEECGAPVDEVCCALMVAV